MKIIHCADLHLDSQMTANLTKEQARERKREIIRTFTRMVESGDLIFYVGRYPGVIGHVAIYIGNGKIIHAASESKGICVSSWKYGAP